MDACSQLRDLPFEEVVGIVGDYPWFGAAQKVLCEKMGRVAGRDLSRSQFADAALHVASREKIGRILRTQTPCADLDIARLLKKYVENAGLIEEPPVVSQPETPDVSARQDIPVVPTMSGVSDVSAQPDISDVSARPETPTVSAPSGTGAVNRSFRGVGDYFSREQYEQTRRDADGWVRHGMFAGDRAAGKGAVEVRDAGGAAAAATEAVGRSPESSEAEIPTGAFCTEAIARIYEEQGYFDTAKEIYAKLILKYPEKNTYFAALIEKLNLRQKN